MLLIVLKDGLPNSKICVTTDRLIQQITINLTRQICEGEHLN